MSFSYDVKQELSQSINFKNKELLKAILMGYFLTANTSRQNNIEEYITNNEYNIEALYKILFNLKIEYEPEVIGKSYKAQIKDLKFVDECIKLLDSDDINVQKNILKGVFLGAGSINDPMKHSHLEIVFVTEERAKIVKEIAKKQDLDFRLVKKTIRKKNLRGKYEQYFLYVLYLKSNEQISNFLAVIGSNKGVLNFEDSIVMRQMKNNINRKVNCETANLSKTVDAAFDQINDIKLIQKKNEFDKMEQDLQEIAMVRLNNPDDSLKELGEKLTPQLGKSGVSHRMKRIHEIAEELRK